jgi:hypothetical protein
MSDIGSFLQALIFALASPIWMHMAHTNQIIEMIQIRFLFRQLTVPWIAGHFWLF